MSPANYGLHNPSLTLLLLNSTDSSSEAGPSASTQGPYGHSIIPYVMVGLLGAFVWDIISNIGYDYKLLWRWPIEKPAAAYVISRIATLLSILFGVLFDTTTSLECTTIVMIERCSFAIALSMTTLILFFRVRALYRDSPVAIAFFFSTWLFVVVAAVLETIVGNSTKIQRSSNTCAIEGKDGPFIIVGAIAPLINDVVIYCAIARKLLITAHIDDEPDVKRSIKIVAFGHHLPALAKTFLQDGQVYLLALIPTYATTIIMFCLKPHDLSYSILTTFPTIVVANLMIGKIYRRMRLGLNTSSSWNAEPSNPLIFNSFPPSQSTSRGDQVEQV